MSRRVVELAVVGLAIASASPDARAAGADGPPAPAPRALVEPARRDLGVLAPGEPGVASFRIENRGGAPLVLTAGKPQPYVAGVRVEVRDAPVPPGGTGTVEVALDTERLSGAGAFRVPVTSNDPRAGTLWLEVAVDVRPLLAADPGYARYVVVQKEREGTIAQTVWSTDGASFRVLEVRSPLPALRTSFRELRPEERRAGVAGAQWHVESTLDAEAPVGALSGDIEVVTDHPRQKRLRIPLSGFVRPVLAVTPPEADLGTVDPAQPRELKLHVKVFASEEIELARAESDVPGLAVEVQPETPGRVYWLVIRPGADLADGPFSGEIDVHTSSAKLPSVVVPVRGRVQRTRADG